MNHHSRAAYWPWVCGLACLLVMSLAAPRLWEQRARQRVLRQAALGQKAVPPATAATVATTPKQPDSTFLEDQKPPPAAPPPFLAGTETAPAFALADAPIAETRGLAGQATDQATGVSKASPLGPASASPAAEPGGPAAVASDLPEAAIFSAPIAPQAAAASSERDPARTPQAPLEVANRPRSQDRPRETLAHPSPQKTTERAPGRVHTPEVVPPAELSGPSGPSEASGDAWEEPSALREYLDDVLSEHQTAAWAAEVKRALEGLRFALREGGPQAAGVLAKLKHLCEQGWSLAEGLPDPALATKVRRVCYALERRQPVWEATAAAGGLRAPLEAPGEPDPQRLALCLGQVDALFRESPQGELWSRFLTLDVLGQLASRRAEADLRQHRRMARAVLDRLSHVRLDAAQRRVIQHPALVALREELRRWAIEPAEWATLLAEIERYEAGGLPADGRRVAQRIQQLALSPLPQRRQLAQHLTAHYRNANVRIAARAEFLNRLLPERPEEVDCVEDCVLGRPVCGQRVTTSAVTVRLIPDTEKIRLALQVDGTVESLTRSVGGAARFLNASHATYTAWKELEIGPEGMRTFPSQVCVHNELCLRGIATDWDGLPLLGALAHAVARSGHENRRQEANAEIEAKVCARAKAQIDAEADARLGALAAEIRQHVLEPLAEMSLGPQVLFAETTNQRLVLRARLAADDQLGAHTPRPMAPGDSLVSMQIHESALTNLVQRLEIDGKTLTLAEIRRRLTERFRPSSAAQTAEAQCNPDPARGPENEEEDEDLTITFAPHDALRLRCAHGQVVLTVAIARLVHNGKSYEDFQVRAVYRPEAMGVEAQLVRDDVIHLWGPRLSTRAQFTLRSIFNKAFSRRKPWSLLPERITRQGHLEGLAITQLVAEDGWLGLALGPARPANPEVACHSDP